MIIFSQGPTVHSRLGNSLIWMSKIQSLLDHTQSTCCFPWAIENFDNYFGDSSFWTLKNDAYNLFLTHTNSELTARSVSLLSRKIERDYEIKNKLKPFEWDELVVYSDEFQLLYICGKNVDITSQNILNQIKSNKLTIIHEPYILKYLNPELFRQEYKNITPCQDLYLDQAKFINSVSLDKRNIGFHIRRGDYKNFYNGKFFYPDDFWFGKVQEFITIDCAVWIFTNEINPVFHDALGEMGAHVSNGSFEVDFVRMMLMNEIYGPPSTFSSLAIKIANSNYSFNSFLKHYPPMF